MEPDKEWQAQLDFLVKWFSLLTPENQKEVLVNLRKKADSCTGIERKKSAKQEIVEKFIKPECIPTDLDCPLSKKFWATQMRLCSKLVKTYGEEFLLWVTPPVKYDSLLSYSGKWGKTFFSQQLVEFKRNLETPTNTQVKTDVESIAQAKKVGEDVQIQKKPKSLQDFLKMYK